MGTKIPQGNNWNLTWEMCLVPRISNLAVFLKATKKKSMAENQHNIKIAGNPHIILHFLNCKYIHSINFVLSLFWSIYNRDVTTVKFYAKIRASDEDLPVPLSYFTPWHCILWLTTKWNEIIMCHSFVNIINRVNGFNSTKRHLLDLRWSVW